MSFMGMRKMLILKGKAVVIGKNLVQCQEEMVNLFQCGKVEVIFVQKVVRKGNYQKEESEIDQLIKKEDIPKRESLETNIQQWKVNSDQTNFLNEPSDQEESTQSETDSIDESDESVSKESDDEFNIGDEINDINNAI